MREMWRERVLELPEHMRESVVLWIEKGEPHPTKMGSFLFAVLTNNLVEAFARADWYNAEHMRDWAVLLANAPPGSHGSEAQLLAWHAAHHPTAPTEETADAVLRIVSPAGGERDEDDVP